MHDLNGDQLLVAAALRVGEIFHGLVTHESTAGGDLPWCEDRRHFAPNPYYCQTSLGLYLDFSHDVPSSIWTPWGDWDFRGSCTFTASQVRTLHDVFTAGVTMQMFREQSYDRFSGYLGPTYALLGVGDLRLPEPALRATRDDYMSYDQARAEWKRMAVEVSAMV